MNLLDRYLAGMFLRRFVITLVGMVALLGVLDALSNADLLPLGGGLGDQFRYMVLRLPVLMDRILIFALLMALLLTYVSLIRSNELVAIAGAGISVFGQVRALIPAVVIATIISAAVIDQMNPMATQALENWLGPEAVHGDRKGPQQLWLADGDLLIEVGGLRDGVLTDVTLFERDEEGRVNAISHAASASHVPGGWALSGVAQIRYDNQPVAPPELWQTAQTPKTLRLLLAEPRDLSLFNLYRLSRMRGSGSLPSDAYLVWFLTRVSLPFVAIGFLLLTVPIMQHFGRNDSGEASLAIGVAAGFVFMVMDGVLKTLSENGSLSAIIAVSVPVVLLLLVGLALALRRIAPG